MLLELRTGLRGAGKTLGAVEALIKQRETDPSRPVYVLGFDELRPDLGEPITFDQLREWRQFPPGSIVYVDEAQKYMPQRKSGDPPRWISDLSESRKVGVDFVFITQHPTLIDIYVRKLVDSHIHTVRKYRTNMVQRFRWPTCQDDPVSRTAVRTVEEKTWHAYSKEAMEAYKSAEIHTVKAQIPGFLKKALWLVALVPLLGWYGIHKLRSVGHVDGAKSAPAAEQPKTAAALKSTGHDGDAAPLTRDQWIAQQMPRVPGVPWSAPIFDNQNVQAQPDLYCASMHNDETDRDTCHCVTEQGTHADVPGALCLSIVKNGIYNPYRKPREDRQGPQPASAPPDPAQSSPAVAQGASLPWPSGVASQTYTPPAAPGSWNPNAFSGPATP
ncbi:zonular occludens toxin domain-containing protein [Dyella sp.]|uniref:zonular occludens toxin domain-containing protein n=1 Tax=Dyella sp. TaxID=1869338 RepID=UPI003F80B2C4